VGRTSGVEDILVLVFSTTRGISAITMAVAHSRGLLDYDEKIATYWPEFAPEGKEKITVKQLLSHQAGLCMIEEALDLDVLADPCRTAEIRARQKPAWRSGTSHGYYHFVLGLYQSREVPRLFTLALLLGKPITARTMTNPPLLHGAPTNFNRRDTPAVEMPSANGIGRVGSVAKPYGAFPTGGAELDLKQGKTLDVLSAPAAEPTSGSHDAVLLADTSYSFGFRKP
jgi:hypothetical protein